MPESCDNSGRLLGGDDVHERAERIKEGQKIRAEVARLAAEARNHPEEK